MPAKYVRVAAVTGATSGIGEATVRRFVADGYGVIGNGRKASKLIELEKELGPSFQGVVGDATDNTVLEDIFAKAIVNFGKTIDIAIANAGRGLIGSVQDADLSQFEDLLKTNVIGALAFIQKAARIMVEDQQNSYPKSAADIIIIGSVVGRHVSPFSAVYGSSKFAVHSLTEALRREIGPKGVRVSLVEPGFVLTGFQAAAGYDDGIKQNVTEKFGPLLVAEDIANAIHYIVNQPPNVHVCDIVVRPTRMDYP